MDEKQLQIHQKDQDNCNLREQNDAPKEQNDAKDAQIVSLEEQIQSFRAENEALQ